jgi:hypothetical protein
MASSAELAQVPGRSPRVLATVHSASARQAAAMMLEDRAGGTVAFLPGRPEPHRRREDPGSRVMTTFIPNAAFAD